MSEPPSETVHPTEPPGNVVFQPRADVHIGRKIAAWFMLADAALQIGVSLFLAAGRGHFLPVIIEALLGIYILRGSMRAITWAQFLTVLAAIVWGGMACLNGEIAGSILILAGQGALLRLLASKPNKPVTITCAVLLLLAAAAGVIDLFSP